MALHACTIVARNYLPHARVLARSFLAQHPGSRFTTLVIDDRSHETSDEPFAVLHLDELVRDEAQLHLLATYYDVMELATAVKPLLLLRLLREHAGPVAYLDPDIEVYSPLTTVEEAAGRRPIVLTPHSMVPYPRDGLRPTEAEIMGSGIYNLGFIAVAPGAEPFLRWWWERLERDAVVDPAKMLFTDQRWIDFVPSMFEHEILKDPGLNVAYWNLHGRDVARQGRTFTVDGGPLRFFHYSGYSPFRPDVLSKHQGDHPRVRLEDAPAVAELAHAYGERLLTEGLVAKGAPRYGWSGEGPLVLDPPMRRAYQQAVRAADAGRGPLPPNPFAGDPGAFVAWLAAPAPGRRWSSVNRYLYALYDMRPDVRDVYPEGRRGSERGYLDWAAGGGVDVQGVAAQLAGQAPLELDESGLPAVQVVGYFTAELGMGEHGRQLVEAVREAGADVGTTTWTETLSRQEHPFQEAHSVRPPRVNLLVVNADQTPLFAKTAGPDFFAGRYTIGAWAWEVEDFPADFDEAFETVDEVWANSDFARDAIARRTTKPVLSVPPPLPAPEVDPTITRADLGLPEGYLFLFSFDYLSVLQRKNPLGLIEAFSRAFAPGEGPVLVLKSINGERVGDARAAVRRAAAARPDVLLLEDYLSPAERTALVAHCDCYVSLHRSEGLGLTMAEAMALAKPVIATGYSGNTTFMDEGNSLLVPYDLVPVGPDAPPYPPAARWAEPRLDDAARLLRLVHDDRELATRLGRQARRDVLDKHSPAARARLVEARLTEIAELLPPAHPGQRRDVATLSLSLVRRKVQRVRTMVRVARTPEMRRQAVRRRLGPVGDAAVAKARRARAQADSNLRESVALRRAIEGLGETVDGTAAHLSRVHDALTERLDELARRADEAAAHLQRVDDELSAAPYVSDPAALHVPGQHGSTIGYDDRSGRGPSSYAEFEDLFRGTEELIRSKQAVYLPLLEQGPVLDVGCGRGEMLALLRDAGVTATGIDSDASMVERGRAQGLDVVLGDALEHLRSCEPGSYGAVTSFQVIEHLPLDALVEFFALAHRALRPGGVMISETVNPHSSRALKAFWLDLTHRHPVYPEAALLLAHRAGFPSAEIVLPGRAEPFDTARTTAGEYAVVARR